VIFEAIAAGRGLSQGLIVTTRIGTWNYANGEAIRYSRRFRQGQPVNLYPADPVTWNVYSHLLPEAKSYNSF
jgi:hypothetical protein